MNNEVGSASVFASGSIWWLVGLLGTGICIMAITTVYVKQKRKRLTPLPNAN